MRMEERIPMSGADLSEEDVAAVVAVVRSGRLALGPQTEAFEAAMADYVGVPHAVAVSSGSAALHLLVVALGLGPGDEVLVPSFTFAACANAILYTGARPVFVDMEPDTFTVDPADLEAKITPRTRAVLAVDVFGHPVEWDTILAVAARHDLAVIDDACEAIGATYRGVRIGSLGDAAAFGFYPNKQMTTGEGGMIVTKSEKLASLCRSLRNQGRGKMGSWLSYERLGFNYRIDEMSAALGVSQLRRIEMLLAKRDRVAAMYDDRLRGLEAVHVPVTRAHVRRSYFVYAVTLAEGLTRDPVMAALAARGIPTRAYFEPLHEQPYLCERLGPGPRLPVTEALADRTVVLPFHGNLTRAQVNEVVTNLGAAIGAT
jgi:perosamine synthetase